MPPAVVQNASSSNRRSTGSIRQRENRVHSQQLQAGSGSARRRKSRSPDARATDEAPLQPDNALRRKKRTSHTTGAGPSLSNAAAMGVSRMSIHEEQSGDRGRTKAKSKPRTVTMWVDDEDDDTHIVTNIMQEHGRSVNTPNARVKRKERSRSRDGTHRLSRKTVTPEPVEDDDEPMYTGPLAQAEYTRMKQEMESLRKVRSIACYNDPRVIDDNE